VVAHLLGRSDHVRGVIGSGMSMLAGLIREIFGDPDQLRIVLSTEDTRPGPRFRQVFGDVLDREPLFATLALPRPVLEEVCFLILRENAGAGFPEIT
jgi:hypothetical protein